MFSFINKGEHKKKGKSKQKQGEENFENKKKSNSTRFEKTENVLEEGFDPNIFDPNIIVSKEIESKIFDETDELRNPNKKIFAPGFFVGRERRENVQVNIIRGVPKEPSVDFLLNIAEAIEGKKEKSEEKLEFVFSSPKITPIVFGKREPESVDRDDSFVLPAAVKTDFSPTLNVKTFLQLMRNKDIDSIKFLLPKKDPKRFIESLIRSSQETDEQERSIFHIAVLEQNYEVVRLLRELGVCINHQDSSYQTPLHYAARYLSYGKESDEETILELLKFDNSHAVLTQEDSYRMTPIDYASLHKDKYFFKALENFSHPDETALFCDVSLGSR